MSAGGNIRGRGVVKGRASGPAMICREPISFLGDLDIRTGEVVGDLPSVRGRRVGGAVLIFPASMGSAGAWRFLYQLYVHGNHPVALVTTELPDPSIVQGAILAGIPVIAEVDASKVFEDGDLIDVDGESGTIRCL